MAIASVSGNSPANHKESAKGVSTDFKPKEKPETVIDKKNKEENLNPGIANNGEKLNDTKGIEGVDVKI
jgi:hypothetical protein